MRYFFLMLALIGSISAAAVSIAYAGDGVNKGRGGCESEAFEDSC